jgi:enoyl-CoA hydratase/carnithine racemase
VAYNVLKRELRASTHYTPLAFRAILMSEILELSKHGRVQRIALNRPDKRNALSSELCRELVDAINRANRHPEIGAIVLTGNGESFSAGMDLKELGNVSVETINNVHEQLFTLSMRLGRPLIGAINGVALGGGAGLVANCHIAIANENAKFGLTEIRLGMWPFLVFRAMNAAVGERRAVELALTGRTFDVKEAHEMGLVHEIAADPNARAMEIAQALSEASPTAIRSGLDFVQEVRNKDWATAGIIARRVRDELFRSLDFQEGVRAFKEKRPPKWPSIQEWGGQ